MGKEKLVWDGLLSSVSVCERFTHVFCLHLWCYCTKKMTSLFNVGLGMRIMVGWLMDGVEKRVVIGLGTRAKAGYFQG